MDITTQRIEAILSELTAPGKPMEVVKRTVDGREYKAFKNAFPNFVDLLNAGRVHGDKEYLIYQDIRLTYAEVFVRADSLAATFQKTFGIKPGDRIAIAMRNHPDWIISFIAAALAGAVVVPINSWGKSDDLLYCISDCGAACVIMDLPRYELIADAALPPEIRLVVSGASAPTSGSGVHQFDELIREGRHLSYETANPAPEDICFILYTSGSTGMPKGVAHRHVAVGQAVMTMFYQPLLLAILDEAQPDTSAAQPAALLTIPLFHASGLMSTVLTAPMSGTKVVMMYKWDPALAPALIEKEKVTAFPTVPTIMKEFLSHPEIGRHDISSLKSIAGGGAAIPEGVAEMVIDKLGPVTRSMGYGMTETLATGFNMAGRLFDWKPYSGGLQSPIMDVRIVAEDGEVLHGGELGEIQFRGITLFAKYWGKPEATEAAFTQDGYLRTGDVGFIDDDRFIHVTGRLKEMVIRGGENIYPAEIEQAAYRSGMIQEVVVFGVDDPHMGEELALVCFPLSGTAMDAGMLRTFLQQHLPQYKVPKHIVISAEQLPRNASEKLHKRAVQERFIAGNYTLSQENMKSL